MKLEISNRGKLEIAQGKLENICRWIKTKIQHTKTMGHAKSSGKKELYSCAYIRKKISYQ